MNYSIEKLQNLIFPREFRGYNKESVLDVIDRIVDDYRSMKNKVERMKGEIHALRESLEQYTTIEDSLKNALIVAQSTADDIKKTASENADDIVKNAEEEKRLIVDSIKTDTLEQVERLDELKKESVMFLDTIESMLIKQLEMVRMNRADESLCKDAETVTEELKSDVSVSTEESIEHQAVSWTEEKTDSGEVLFAEEGFEKADEELTENDVFATPAHQFV